MAQHALVSIIVSMVLCGVQSEQVKLLVTHWKKYLQGMQREDPKRGLMSSLVVQPNDYESRRHTPLTPTPIAHAAYTDISAEDITRTSSSSFDNKDNRVV